jgi:predicted CXXCH cytochrome family protein
MKPNPCVRPSPEPNDAAFPIRIRRLALAAGTALIVTVVLISCTTLTRTVMAPPSIPGASHVGTAACADCHYELVRDFDTASHARLQARGPNALDVGCESCHGPGDLHVQSGGDTTLIVNPLKSPDVCFACHLNVRGSFSLPHHHPVPEGHLTCTDCHDPHRGDAFHGGRTAFLSANQACTQCHTAQQGPHVFEHEALREGCTTCHHPHGSVNAKLLTQRNATLCLQCHFQQQAPGGQVFIGGFNHTGFLQRGTCWNAGCHEAVHGSQVNSSLRF